MSCEQASNKGSADSGEFLGYTATGKKRKKNKWISLSKQMNEEYNTLLQKATALEKEHSSLRAKETLLLQVLENLQAIFEDAVQNAAVDDQALQQPAGCTSAHATRQASGAGGSSSQRASGSSSGPSEAVFGILHQHEPEIAQLYQDMLNTMYPQQQQQQLQGLRVLTVMRDPKHLQQVCTMTSEQVVTRLSELAGKCAIGILRSRDIQLGASLADAAATGSLHDSYMEFSALIMSAMIWQQDKFRAIVQTNLDTLQPFEEPPSSEHWLKALQQVQLTEQQLQVMSYLHNQHYQARRARVQARMQANFQQQTTHTNSLVHLLQRQTLQDKVQGAGGSSMPARGVSIAPAQQQTIGPAVDTAVVAPSEEMLLEEQSKLLQEWLFLGLHVGIVTACTMSTYQQAVFVAASYPSIPRMDLAMAVYMEQQQKQQSGPMSANVTTAAGVIPPCSRTPSA